MKNRFRQKEKRVRYFFGEKEKRRYKKNFLHKRLEFKDLPKKEQKKLQLAHLLTYTY